MKAILITFVFISFTLICNAQAKFNGKWTIQKEKSDFGGLDENIASAGVIEVIQTKDSVNITRLFSGLDPIVSKLSLNGENVVDMANADTKRTSKVEWQEEKKTLLFTMLYNVGNNDWSYRRTEKWQLSADGKQLTVDRITYNEDGTDRVKAVYTK